MNRKQLLTGLLLLSYSFSSQAFGLASIAFSGILGRIAYQFYKADYDADKTLALLQKDAEQLKNSTVEEIHKMAIKNGVYTKDDVEKMLSSKKLPTVREKLIKSSSLDTNQFDSVLASMDDKEKTILLNSLLENEAQDSDEYKKLRCENETLRKKLNSKEEKTEIIKVVYEGADREAWGNDRRD